MKTESYYEYCIFIKTRIKEVDMRKAKSFDFRESSTFHSKLHPRSTSTDSYQEPL